jgi:putative ABC transport system permease protein
MYVNEQRLARLFSSFAALAVFISCLGLVGLSAYLAEERTKEIGIRKALGASTGGIVSLFSMEFLKLVAAANVIAWPAGYLLMHRWLQGYAFRTSIGFRVFALAAAIGLLTALVSVGWQTFRASTANPVDSLRYE